MTCSITSITMYGNNTASVQPAHISRGRFLHHNLGVRQTHRAYTLAGIAYMEKQLFALSIPQWTANVMLTRSMYLKLSFTVADSFLNGQQQILGGHTIMSLNSFYLKHFRTPPLLAYILDAQLISNSLISRYQSITTANRLELLPIGAISFFSSASKANT